MTILVSGGAGYIGSHTVLYLKQKGLDVVVFDNIQTGHSDAVKDVPFIKGDLRDEAALKAVFEAYPIEAVIHFAASSLVGESVQEPLKYYENNVGGTLSLLKQMVAHDVKHIVFSSTAATYGEPKSIPIKESDPTVPTNPYGETKLAIEKMFKWSEAAYGLKSVSLRYFNAAGADPEGTIGEDHQPESHLIPLILQVALGQREHISVFGNDYPTEDGTCIRDYIHVMDLADAHFRALEKLKKTGESGTYNLGNGKGFSVKEVIEACRRVTNKEIPAVDAPRRAGDPAVLIASSEKAEKELGWKPQYPELEKIVEHAWAWHSHHPNGYNDK
ncbi:UDP-glucose 4-epimerase [Pullulanibacillus pueri]|uniref:UDP-glucose 4-epimerase n=1 Tax=Pullulanibacillus pueri TaxID=1437324 RepID=A0A8J2ZZD4_9BACL|nr:UDP-glucose 4-epimerase GalE [Pullulanibacillus pueri]MBM7680708.1 UDP-glucose 4-epimerase [Pullulanibacillus pueri]GGH87566.1 UDP-glucose 4-epimerase GalE [Pullulanibacillus pueri]